MKDGISNTLSGLAALLRAEGYDYHADEAERTLTAFANDSADACSLLASGIFWGGAGSIADVHFCRENLNFASAEPAASSERLNALRDRDDSEFRLANRQLTEFLIRLSQEFSSACGNQPTFRDSVARAQVLGGIYKRWISEGLR